MILPVDDISNAASEEECSTGKFYASFKCGESDTTTGLASCPTAGNVIDRLLKFKAHDLVTAQLMKVWSEYNDFIDKNKTNDLS